MTRNQNGTVFITTLVCLFLMILMATYVFDLTSRDVRIVNQMKKSAQALYLAEAGLNQALATIAMDATAIDDDFPSTSLGGGVYDAAVTLTGGRYLVSSAGTVDGMSHAVSAEVRLPPLSALGYALAGGAAADDDDLIWVSGGGGASGTLTGDVYSATDVVLGNTVNGDIYANGTITTTGGTEHENFSDQVEFPDIQFSEYLEIAAANGYSYSGNKTYNNGNRIPSNPAGGVIYVDGNITVYGTQTTTACIIANGNITFAKSGNTPPKVTINQYGSYPALMTVNGSITFSCEGAMGGGGDFTVNGLIYSGGDFAIVGNHEEINLTGSILARGRLYTAITSQSVLNMTFVEQIPPFFDPVGGTVDILSYNA